MPTPDPWLTDEGDVVPALDWAGMPEWEDVDLGLRLILARAEHSWTIKERDKSPRAFYCYDQHTTPYEAHAIIEKWLREKRSASREPVPAPAKETDHARSQ